MPVAAVTYPISVSCSHLCCSMQHASVSFLILNVSLYVCSTVSLVIGKCSCHLHFLDIINNGTARSNLSCQPDPAGKREPQWSYYQMTVGMSQLPCGQYHSLAGHLE